MRATPALASFNAGELSPYMEGRVDQTRYQNGVRTLQNFFCAVQGPAIERAGFAWVAPVKNSANRCWLHLFEFSVNQAYVLEFGNQYLRFYTQHGQLQVSNVAAWSNATAYSVGALVASGGVNYYCVAANTSQAPPNATYWYALTGTVYEIPTPWLSSDLVNAEGAFALKFEQSGDILYIAGGAANAVTTAGYQPYTLTRYGTTDWVLAPYAPTDGPFLTENTNPNWAMWVSAISGAGVTIQSNLATFAATDVGRLVRIAQQNYNVAPWQTAHAYTKGALSRYNGNTYKALNSATSGGSTSVAGNPPTHTSGTAYDGPGGVQWLYMDSGYGIAQITAYTSATQVTATVLTQFPQACVGVPATITAITQANPAAVTATNSFAQGDTVLIYGVNGMTQINNAVSQIDTVSGSGFTLDTVNSTGYGAYTSGGTVVDGASTYWMLGAWSNTTEWPRAVTFFRNRLFWFGALGIWGSVPALYTSHALDTAGVTSSDNAISIYLSSNLVTTINWAVAVDRLFIGTDGGEFALYEQTTTEALGPGNVQYPQQSKKGCRTIPGILVNTSVLYWQRAGRKLMAADYDIYIDKYHSYDQTAWAYHITTGTVVDAAYVQEPWSILWQARADGTLIGFTFDREQDVYGWHEHPVGATLAGAAKVEAVCPSPAPSGGYDELWAIVNRTIGGQTVRSVEYMSKIYETGDSQSSCFYVDAGATYNGAATQTIGGLAYLNGETVQVLTNGAVHPPQTVVNGQISLQWAASVVNVGLGYKAVLVTERPEAGSEAGSAQGKIKRTNRVAVRFYNTLGGFVGLDGGTLDEIPFRDATMNMDQAPPLFSGDKIVTFPGDYSTDNCVHVEQDQPLPMTVVGCYPQMSTYEPT